MLDFLTQQNNYKKNIAQLAKKHYRSPYCGKPTYSTALQVYLAVTLNTETLNKQIQLLYLLLFINTVYELLMISQIIKTSVNEHILSYYFPFISLAVYYVKAEKSSMFFDRKNYSGCSEFLSKAGRISTYRFCNRLGHFR